MTPLNYLLAVPSQAGIPTDTVPLTRSSARRRLIGGVALVSVLVGTLACHDLSGLTGKQLLPSGVQDPSVYHTAAGARAQYEAALASFFSVRSAFPGSKGGVVDAMLTSGVLADELQAGTLGAPTPQGASLVNFFDARMSNTNYTRSIFYSLQRIRGNASLAIGALAAYDSAAPPALRGRLYVLTGYAEVLLADLFCSGVPLSTVDFGKDFTYHASSTTDEVYHAAIAQFDTALALSGDSVQIQNLAWAGKARAYLNLGQYDSAAAAAAYVPTSFAEQYLVTWGPVVVDSEKYLGYFENEKVTVADKEGVNGLPFVSSGDPRSASQLGNVNQFGQVLRYPVKYGGSASSTASSTAPLTVADGIEARLIQAEAAYHGVATGQGSWLQQLNALRATAITPALPELTDPGTPSAQVDLIFEERAYWLFLTGHRLGDLRRLVRDYGRSPNTVFPRGSYPRGTTISVYGSVVSLPIPDAELVNPLFHGCLSQGA